MKCILINNIETVPIGRIVIADNFFMLNRIRDVDFKLLKALKKKSLSTKEAVILMNMKYVSWDKDFREYMRITKKAIRHFNLLHDMGCIVLTKNHRTLKAEITEFGKELLELLERESLK